MKLHNKETGEIRDYKDVVSMRDANNWHHRYHSLAELNEEWEDYKEPKMHWYIGSDESIQEMDCVPEEYQEDLIKCQNCFETKEEAELAVCKLKAWKRLKDKGFRFTFYDTRSGSENNGKIEGEFVMFSECDALVDKNDLDLLFGGEE